MKRSLRRFRQAHFYDYRPTALRYWLLLVAIGGACAAWAVASLAAEPAWRLGEVLVGLVLVALAASFPVLIPRTSHAVAVSDLFIFALLVATGPAGAVLAAAVDGFIGAARASRRLAPRLSTPATGATAMFVAGHAQVALAAQFGTFGIEPMAAVFAALVAVAPLYFVFSTLPLTALLAVKQRRPLDLKAWWAGYAWVAALYLAAAAVAGLVHLNTQQFGVAVMVVGAVATLAIVTLLRYTMNRQEWERRAQEARIAQAERDARVNQQRFTAAFTHAAAGMAIVDPAGRLMQVNHALAAMLGAPEEELLGRAFAAHLHAGDAELFERQTAEVLRHRERSFSIELRLITRNGHERGAAERSRLGGKAEGGERADRTERTDLWVSLQCSHFDDPGQTGTCLIYQVHDISSRRLAESRLQHIVFHDSLTDLANRHFFEQRLAVAVERGRAAQGREGRPFAVILLDLDRFKLVNDSLGHIAGDHMLREVARRLAEAVAAEDLVARLGGDEFAVLIEGADAAAEGPLRARGLLAALTQPLVMHGTELLPGASVGVTVSSDGPRSVDEVLRDAELAMYAAKDAGRGRVFAFAAAMHERIADKLALEADLRRAIGAGQLNVVFQPIYELDPWRLYGFEALARWVHAERGAIPPQVFVTLAEESGHIEALSAWVVEHAVQQLAQWQRADPRFRGLAMHVNISGRDLQQARFVAHVQHVLSRHAVPAAQLALEITETTLMGQLDQAVLAMQRLRELGVRLSIDDFGTGYSSLAYLSTLPIDSLKIDRSFVMQMESKPQNVEIVRAVMNLGVSLGKRVVAEGIETEGQLAQLRALGVPAGQGFLLSPPLRAEQVPAALSRLPVLHP
ncbi:MAG: EAL domain-containing protein [Rubrivivax sp.]|nr:EAL domain-containing protein [Rubrivivax sp.]